MGEVEVEVCVPLSCREKPLAFYVFTESKKTFEKIRNFTSAGGVCHNDTIMHSGREYHVTCM